MGRKEKDREGGKRIEGWEEKKEIESEERG